VAQNPYRLNSLDLPLGTNALDRPRKSLPRLLPRFLVPAVHPPLAEQGVYPGRVAVPVLRLNGEGDNRSLAIGDGEKVIGFLYSLLFFPSFLLPFFSWCSTRGGGVIPMARSSGNGDAMFAPSVGSGS